MPIPPAAHYISCPLHQLPITTASTLSTAAGLRHAAPRRPQQPQRPVDRQKTQAPATSTNNYLYYFSIPTLATNKNYENFNMDYKKYIRSLPEEPHLA